MVGGSGVEGKRSITFVRSRSESVPLANLCGYQSVLSRFQSRQLIIIAKSVWSVRHQHTRIGSPSTALQHETRYVCRHKRISSPFTALQHETLLSATRKDE